MAEKKEKRYVSDNAQLMSEWDFKRNNNLNPSDVLEFSNKKVWWICQKGHSWEESVCNRSKGRGCPYCSGHRVLVGFNDLTTTAPSICAEWDYDKNKCEPQLFSKGSSYNAWWICPMGHSYQSKISNRTLLNRGCPYCSGRYALKGENDLQTTNPRLEMEWDYDKNDILPTEITAGSSKKVWWKGMCGHSWQASVNSRNKGAGCPFCGHVKLNKDNCLAN